MRNKTFKRLITEKEIMRVCVILYGEQMRKHTFTNMSDYSKEVRKIVSDKLQLVDKYDQLNLDSYVSSIIIYMFNI